MKISNDITFFMGYLKQPCEYEPHSLPKNKVIHTPTGGYDEKQYKFQTSSVSQKYCPLVY